MKMRLLEDDHAVPTRTEDTVLPSTESHRTDLPPARGDPEFGTFRAIVPAPREWETVSEDYLRVLANPFLAIAGFAFWGLALFLAIESLRIYSFPSAPFLPLVMIFLFFAAFLTLPRLAEFHCLDCGATGHLSQWRKHRCFDSILRHHLGQPVRRPGPRPMFQVFFWLGAFVLLIVLANVVGLIP